MNLTRSEIMANELAADLADEFVNAYISFDGLIGATTVIGTVTVAGAIRVDPLDQVFNSGGHDESRIVKFTAPRADFPTGGGLEMKMKFVTLVRNDGPPDTDYQVTAVDPGEDGLTDTLTLDSSEK